MKTSPQHDWKVLTVEPTNAKIEHSYTKRERGSSKSVENRGATILTCVNSLGSYSHKLGYQKKKKKSQRYIFIYRTFLHRN